MFTLTVCLQAACPSACAATPGPPSPSSRPPSLFPAGFRACQPSAPPRCPTCPEWAWAAAWRLCPPCRPSTAGCTSSAPPASPSSGVALASTPRPWWPTSPSSSAAPPPLTSDRGDDASLLLLFADVCSVLLSSWGDRRRWRLIGATCRCCSFSLTSAALSSWGDRHRWRLWRVVVAPFSWRLSLLADVCWHLIGATHRGCSAFFADVCFVIVLRTTPMSDWVDASLLLRFFRWLLLSSWCGRWCLSGSTRHGCSGFFADVCYRPEVAADVWLGRRVMVAPAFSLTSVIVLRWPLMFDWVNASWLLWPFRWRLFCYRPEVAAAADVWSGRRVVFVPFADVCYRPEVTLWVWQSSGAVWMSRWPSWAPRPS